LSAAAATAGPDAPGRNATSAVAGAPTIAFALTMLFVLVDYLRPQDWIAPLRQAPIAVVAAIPLILCLVQRARASTLRDPMVVTLALLTAFCMAWTPFATNNFHAFEMFKMLALETLAVVAIGSFIDQPRRLGMLLFLLLIGFGAQAIWALGHGGRGLTSHFGDENDLALGMNVALPFAVFGAFAVRTVWLRLLLLVTAGLFVAAVVVSDSRGGLVGLAGTCVAMLLFARRRVRIGLALALGVALLLALAPDSYWSEMRTMFDSQDATREERLRSWEQARAVWRDNPVLGVGPGNVAWVIGQYETYDTRLTHSLGGRAVHSLYFELLADLGLVGVALYGTLAVLILLRCVGIARGRDVMHAHAWARAIPCSLVACLTSGIFLSVLYYPHLYLRVALTLAIPRLQAAAGAVPAAPQRRAWATPLRVAMP
jgi:probable O-glycosylation ligase (exosortase A-associated)